MQDQGSYLLNTDYKLSQSLAPLAHLCPPLFSHWHPVKTWTLALGGLGQIVWKYNSWMLHTLVTHQTFQGPSVILLMSWTNTLSLTMDNTRLRVLGQTSPQTNVKTVKWILMRWAEVAEQMTAKRTRKGHILRKALRI